MRMDGMATSIRKYNAVIRLSATVAAEVVFPGTWYAKDNAAKFTPPPI